MIERDLERVVVFGRGGLMDPRDESQPPAGLASGQTEEISRTGLCDARSEAFAPSVGSVFSRVTPVTAPRHRRTREEESVRKQ